MIKAVEQTYVVSRYSNSSFIIHQPSSPPLSSPTRVTRSAGSPLTPAPPTPRPPRARSQPRPQLYRSATHNPQPHPAATPPKATHPKATHPKATHPKATHPEATHPSHIPFATQFLTLAHATLKGITEWLRGSALATPPFYGTPVYLPRYHVLGGVLASVALLWVLQKLLWLRCGRPESLRDRRSGRGAR